MQTLETDFDLRNRLFFRIVKYESVTRLKAVSSRMRRMLTRNGGEQMPHLVRRKQGTVRVDDTGVECSVLDDRRLGIALGIVRISANLEETDSRPGRRGGSATRQPHYDEAYSWNHISRFSPTSEVSDGDEPPRTSPLTLT